MAEERVEVSQEEIAEFCRGCDFQNPDNSCNGKIEGVGRIKNQAGFVRGGFCGFTSVNGVTGTRTRKGFERWSNRSLREPLTES